MPIDGWLTTTEVAAVLQIHPKHVYRLIKKGLPAHRVGGQWRFLSEEILEWSSPTKRTGVSAEDIHQVDNAAPVLATERGIILDAAHALLNHCGYQFACVTTSPSELP
ncbi:MAG: helix-turn-helix domain-containing protein, partial [Polyangiaceae bacterium]|nr:helix-turn-helix domain-containing protein [Polyangiaceae bacterium]